MRNEDGLHTAGRPDRLLATASGQGAGRPNRAPLTGRDAELAALRDALTPVDDALGGWAALVVAEAGAGKSRLVEEAVRVVAPPPERTIVVRGGELTATLPFVALRRALRPHAGASVGALDLDLPGTDEVSRRSVLIEACTDVVERLTFDGPVVLVVDDAHWLDSASSTVLDLLARQLPSLPLHMVVAARPHPRPRGQSALWRTLRRTGRLTRLDLHPLRPAHALRVTEALLGGRAGPRVQSLVERAGGNPLYCTELGIACRDRVTRDDAGVLDLARPVRAVDLDVIDQNLAALDATCRTRLADLALLGSSVSVADLALLAGQSAATVMDDLGPALSAGVLTGDDEGLLRFRHDLVRDAVLGAMPRAAAAARHGDIVDAFADAGRPCMTWAGHLPLADWTGRSDGWAIFERVGEEMAAQAPAEAADLLGHARDTLPGDPPLSFLSLHLEVLLDADLDLDAIALVRSLPRHLERERAGTSAATIDLLAVRLLEAYWGLRGMKDGPTVAELLEPVLEAAGPVTRDVLAVDDHLGAALLEARASHAAPVLEVAAHAWAQGHDRLAATAASYGAVGLLFGGDLRGCADALVSWARRLLDDGCRPATVEAMVTALDLSVRASDEVVDPLVAAAMPLERLGPPITVALGLLSARRALADGRWTEALGLVDDFVHWDADHNYSNLGLPTRATTPVLTYVGVGRFDDARLVLRPGEERRRNLHPPERAVHLSTHFRDRAIVDLLTVGTTPTLDRAFVERLRGPVQRACDRELPLYVSLAAAAERHDLVDAYDQHVAGAGELQPLHAELLDLLAGRDTAGTTTVADRFLARHDFLTATAIASVTDDVAAVEILHAMHRRARDCGATTWEARAESDLAARGVPVGDLADDQRPASGLDALTPAERRVLPLILDGLLYREIAEELHNSRRTIESHAASILRKLGASSRRDLASIVDAARTSTR